MVQLQYLDFASEKLQACIKEVLCKLPKGREKKRIEGLTLPVIASQRRISPLRQRPKGRMLLSVLCHHSVNAEHPS